MLEVFRSNKLDVLAAMLAAQIGRPGALPEDPFLPLRVVVGSKGMERWLRHSLAASLPGHICANACFPFPQHVLAQALLYHEALLHHEALQQQEAGAAPVEELDPWSNEVLPWILLEVLPPLLAEPDPRNELAPLRAYLEGEGAGPAGARALELARQLADVFDRLVVFRPEIAVDWSRGEVRLPRGAAELAWQPRLWAAVQRHLLALGRAQAHSAQRWLSVVARGGPDPACFDQPLRVFGVSFLPPASLRQFAWLSQAVDVELYLTCPSDAWWAGLHGLGSAAVRQLFDLDRDRVAEALVGFEAVHPHPLLQSLGRVGRDQQLVLEEAADDRVPRREQAAFVDPAHSSGPARALHALQSDLLHLRDPAALDIAALEARALDPGDDSIQFHACYGLTRQVEVLREALLHLFEAHPDLQPRDVLVMAPDIEACVPLVGAVFDQGLDSPAEASSGPGGHESARWGRAGAPRVPCVVSERSVRSTNPVAEALLRVLALAGGQQRASSAAVLDLLAVEPFRRRFGIEQADREVIASWVAESGVRWALDPADRARSQQPAELQNTWRFGLERLALGVTMADSPGRLWDPPAPGAAPPPERALGIAPFDPVEGGILHLLGRFFDACTTLFDALTRLRDTPGGRPLSSWIDAVLEVQERLTATAPASAWLSARVRAELEALRAAAQAAGSARSLRIEAFLALLERRFEIASGATRAHAGAVTFASMLPYRSVPYRVICLLGMDEGAFPRNPTRPRFDLTQRSPRAGDHDPRDEDRHLLLEALLAAGDHLLVLYTGRDPRSNERRAPAVPIAELQAVIDASFPAIQGRRPSAWLTREHPLQPFSPRCFGAGAPPWSYDRDLLEGCRASLLRARTVHPFFDPELELPAAEELASGEKPTLELTLDELARFLRNPTRALLARGLNLHLPPDEEPPPEREPIEPEGLDRWSWSKRLLAERWARLAARWGDAAAADLAASGEARLRAEGLLPLGAGGQRWAEAPAALVEGLMAEAGAWFGDATAPVPPGGQPLELLLELPTHRVRLLGASGPVWCGDQLVLGVGDIEGQGKYRLEPWLRHLAWVAAEAPPEARTVLIFGRIDSHGVPRFQRASLSLALPEGAEPQPWARARLSALAGLYVAGLRAPLPLFEQASWAFVKRSFYRGHQQFHPEDLTAPEGSLDPKVEGHILSAWAAASQAFGAGEGSEYSSTDLADPHIALAWAATDPTTAQRPAGPALSIPFARRAMLLWEPVFAGWQKEGKKTPIAPRLGAAGGTP